MKINCWAILAFLLLMFSCNKHIIDENDGLDNFSEENSSIVTPFFAGDGLYDVLGEGYDVTQDFAHPNSVRQPVIDIARLVNDRFGDFHQNHHVIQESEHITGQNTEDYSEKLSNKFDLGVPLFGGSIRRNFSETTTFNNKHSYGSYYKYIQHKRLGFFTPTSILAQQYLTQAFVNDIETLSPRNIVVKYGTHVLADIFLGGKLEVHYKTESNTRDYSRATEAGLKAGLTDVFSISADITTNITHKSTNFNQRLYYRTLGGDGTKGLEGTVNLDGSSVPSINIQQWQSSCNKDNVALINIGENGLIPIQDLISSPSKKTALTNYINQYFQDNRVKISDHNSIRYGMYKLTNVRSGLVLTIAESSTNPGQRAIQWNWGYFPDRQWTIEKHANNTYKLINANSGQVLAVADASFRQGHRVIQWPWTGGNEQRWVIERNANNSYRLINYNSGQGLAPADASYNLGHHIVQWPWGPTNNYEWNIELIY